ncbi:spermatogenesis associated 6-like protein [Mugil cephalus]|uniref:spermatogenesis associated 6-like protein n=1 Tax=Mugil cephalus TaxID=48193 RepID=UPI001FB7CA16|nr:spermatogenesis associated 6-like protein [Mugil cephalus]
MIRASHFPGIAPRLEFSTTTTITECPPDAQIKVYPNEPMRPVMRRNSRRPRRPRTASPQKKRPQTARRRRSSRADREETHSDPRSQSLSPLRSGNTRRLAHGRLGSAAVSQPMSSSWPGVSRSAAFTNSSSPLTRSFSTVRYSPTARRKSLSTGLAVSTPDDNSSSSETYDGHYGPDPSTPCSSYRKHAGRSSSYGEWEEIHERVRGLLTTPKAVRRLVCGATVSEVDEVLARRSIPPGPP